jgi:hypothetical protein
MFAATSVYANCGKLMIEYYTTIKWNVEDLYIYIHQYGKVFYDEQSEENHATE